VEIADGGKEALQACAERAFDIIFMDVRMPGVDGLAATRTIRSGDGVNANTPIVGLTAGALREQIEACLAAGMNGHIAKPVVDNSLLDAVGRWAAAPRIAATGAAAPAPASPPRALRASLHELAQRFRERLHEDLDVLAGEGEAEVIQACAHRLAGTGGSLGFDLLGALALTLDQAIARADADWRRHIAPLADAIRSEISANTAKVAGG
jgi:CheY-like chemotaxis protein/HPt (histidine-containing phosphotransfer) domain-containing protein